MRMNLAQRLKEARKKAGLSQAELAERARVRQQSIQKIEDNQTKRPKIIEQLAKILGTTAKWLAFGKKEDEALDQKEDVTYRNVLIYFQQTNASEAKDTGRTGDKAVIKAIHPKELPVYFVSEIDQQKNNYEKPDPVKNPLKSSYVVDVKVETDRYTMPKFYRIIRINKVIPTDTLN